MLTPKKIYSPSITILTPSAYGKVMATSLCWALGSNIVHVLPIVRMAPLELVLDLGDARKYVGLDVGLTLTDLDAILIEGIISFQDPSTTS